MKLRDLVAKIAANHQFQTAAVDVLIAGASATAPKTMKNFEETGSLLTELSNRLAAIQTAADRGDVNDILRILEGPTTAPPASTIAWCGLCQKDQAIDLQGNRHVCPAGHTVNMGDV